MRNDKSQTAKIAVIGNGTIGSAIANLHTRAKTFGRGDNLATVADFDVIIIAVKPQQFEELADQIKEYVSNQMIVSVMAGVKIKNIQDALGTKLVLRTMPNLGITSGQSLTGIFPVSERLKRLVSTWGNVIELNSEAQFDSFTALAGSGPAYVFRLLSCIESQAQAAGFSAETSQRIAAGILNACAASLGSSNASQKTKAVASKGGTTEAALSVFDTKQFNTIIRDAVLAATERSKELST